MNVIFDNGTTRQQDWFIEAMSHAVFPWDRFDQVVRVVWAARADFPPGGRVHHAFAITNWASAPADACGRPNDATITILDDLDDPNRPGNEGGWPMGYYAGKNFYMECCLHELGHVAQMKFSQEQRDRLTLDVYGGHQTSDWDSQDLEWWEQRQESDAETFKDVWLPKQYRKFNNRTKHRLLDYPTYLGVFDEICPCQSTGSCFESQIAYGQRSPGDIGFNTVWFDPQDTNDDVSALGPSHPSTITTWAPILPYDSVTVIVRYGGDGYEVGRENVTNPNPYWSPTHAPLDTYSLRFYDMGNDVLAWRLIGTYGPPVDPLLSAFWWDPKKPSLVPHQLGAWSALVADPVTQDDATGYGFVPDWHLASLKLCGFQIIT